jgi:tetratricopeptide (TPR) repeat protein
MAMISWQKASSQNRLLDSVLHLGADDSVKIDALNKLFLEYEFVDQELAGKCIDRAQELSKEKPLGNAAAFTHYHAGFFAEDKGNYPGALAHYYDAIKIWEKTGNKIGQADASFCIGNIYYLQQNYPEAEKRYSAALKVYTEIGNKQGIANAHNNLGGVNFHQGDYKTALKEYSEGLKLREELGDKNWIADSYINIGNVYSDQQIYDTALTKYFAGLKLMEELGRKGKVSGILSNIGIVYIYLKKYKEARKYLDKSLEAAREFGVKETIRNSYKGLSELDSATGNFKSAFEDYKMYTLYRDSLDNEETRNKTIQEQLSYEFDKKQAVAVAEHKKEMENQQAIAAEKSRKQNIVIGFVIAGLLLVIIFAIFISRALRITRDQKDTIEIQKQLVEQQKITVERQKSLVEGKQKEIIDSINYAKRIQRSQMPTERYIEQSLKRLNKKN